MTDDLFAYASEHPEEMLSPAASPVQTDCSSPARQLPDDAIRIVQVLSGRVGRANAITAPDLADAAGLFQDSPRQARGTQLRHLLTLHLDDLPWPVVADASGYYRPADYAEARHYVANLLARTAGILDRLAAFARLCNRADDLRDVAEIQRIQRIQSHLSAVR